MKNLKDEFKGSENIQFSEDETTATITTKLAGITSPLFVDPKSVFQHFKDEGHLDRTCFINHFVKTIKSPDDIRFDFSVSTTGRSKISAEFVGNFENEDSKKGPIMVVFNAIGGNLQYGTSYPIDRRTKLKGRKV